MSARRNARRPADPKAVDPATVPYRELVSYRAAYWRHRIRRQDRRPPADWAFTDALWTECRAIDMWRSATEQHLRSRGRNPRREWQQWRQEVRDG